jgi:hypothetical protein
MISREKLTQLEENFTTYIAPLLSEQDPEDIHLAWEFQKFLHSLKLKVLTAERSRIKKWKEELLSR